MYARVTGGGYRGGYGGRDRGRKIDGDGGGDDRYRATVPVQLEEGGRADSGVLMGGLSGIGVHVAGCGPGLQGGMGLPWHRKMEVVWKLVTVILNIRPTTYIAFHGVLHGFWAGLGTGTTSLEAKLLQQLMAMR